MVLSSRCFAPLLRSLETDPGARKTSSRLVLQMLGPWICDPCAAAKSSYISRRCVADIQQSQPLYEGLKWNAHKRHQAVSNEDVALTLQVSEAGHCGMHTLTGCKNMYLYLKAVSIFSVFHLI